MAQLNHIIEPERQGLWIAVTFIVALLALVMFFVQRAQTNDMMMATQLEVLKLNQKIEKLQKAPAAPMAPVEQPKAQ